MATAPAAAAPPLPDWAEMQRDALEIIISSLETLPDGLAAAAVCRNWRAAAALSLGRAMSPRRLLWLLTVPSGGRESSDAELFDVFGGASRRTTIPGVGIPGRWKICGSSRGWLLVMHGVDRRLSLVNPFTGDHISLPACPTRDPVKAVVCAGPSSGSCRIILITYCFGYVYSAVSGDKKWQLDRPSTGGIFDWRYYDISDCIYYRGRFLAVDHEGCVLEWGAARVRRMIFEAREGEDGVAPRNAAFDDPWGDVVIAKMILGEGAIMHNFLLAAPWGEVLLAKMRVCRQETRWAPSDFEVFVVNIAEKRLERTENLRSHAMIIDVKQCSLVSVDCHPALSPDSIIYFCTRFPPRDRGMEFPFWRDERAPWNAGVYNLRNRRFLPLPRSLQLPGEAWKHAIQVISPTLEHDDWI